MGRVDGKVAFVTGAARGQGRSHAERLAEEGASVIAVDRCAPIDTAPYEMPTPEDLAETERLVEGLGRPVLTREVDVRDVEALNAAVEAGVGALGKLDVIVANAGIVSFATAEQMSAETWGEMIDINLTGVWHTVKAVLPHLNDGASIVLISSVAGLAGSANLAHYSAAKHGVVGIMRSLAHELGPRMIRVNSVHPASVDTPMVHNQPTYDLFRPDLENPGFEDWKEVASTFGMLPAPQLEPRDIANAVLFLASDEARFITGVTLPVDLGVLAR
jgi:SDR family mycofactocin-dependent oxidoreductase